MTLIRIEPPDSDPIELEEVKAHMRVDSDDEDALIADFINTATRRLDGRDGLLGRCLVTQTWKLVLDCFPPEIKVPLPPCQEISEITYLDAGGAIQTLAPSDYHVVGLGGDDAVHIRPAYGKTWPGTRNTPEAVSITFIAGYLDNDDSPPGALPEPLRTAIKMHVGHLYEHRESVTLGTGFITETPHGYEDLISDFRVWSF